MLTVEDYGVIRRAHRDGMSIRAIARQFHHSRRKVRDALASPEPQPYTRTKEANAPKLGPFKATIDQILAADKEAPPKQRHTAMQVFRRLRDEQHYAGGYDQVRRHIASQRQRHVVTFIPLSHDPGQRLELDFGHIYADFPDGRRQVPVLLPTWSFSTFAFAISLPTERIEAILAGMVAAFEFFGCVGREAWWDNPRTVAAGILRGRERRINVRYAALASHYGFEPLFCMPAAATEKPAAEHKVYDLQRRWCTPVPKVQDHADHIEIVVNEQVLARHERCYGRHQQVLEPLHYLVTLGRRPGALDHSGVYRNWRLPAAFSQLRTALEERHGPHAGSRQYVRVLQLLAEHPQARLQQAIGYCRTRNLLDSELIRSQANRLALRQVGATEADAPTAVAMQTRVPRADLSQFNQLLSIGDPVHA